MKKTNERDAKQTQDAEVRELAETAARLSLDAMRLSRLAAELAERRAA